MITENVSTLKIHKLTQEQYNRELENGNIDENALYLTPDEEVDLSIYATVEQLNGKADVEHTHIVTDITNFPSSLPANGGNADTLDGKHANEFATASDIASLEEKVGDKSVAEQIADTIGVLQTKVDGIGITSIVKKTQAEYDAMAYHDPSTLYVIEG